MIGTQIGGYRVVEQIAEGGMGAVYLARHELMLREAVVKVLLPGLSTDQEMVRRFLNEARAATKIHHPGIVEIFDLGFLPSGQAYIAMERLRGETLAARLRGGPLEVPQLVALTRQLAGALGAAHEAGIVHRDLKPDNLFLCADPSVKDPILPGGERLKILDFGIAKLAQGAGSVATQAGSVFGTPPYMSPEQCTSAGTVDRRSDLYAVGCILFEAATGRPPFGTGGIELVAAHMRDAPPDPRSLVPSLPPRFAELLLRLLEKDPARRPQHCRDLLAWLEPDAGAAAAGAAAGAGFDPARAATLPPPGSARMAVAGPMPTPAAAGERAVVPVATRGLQRSQRLVLVAGGIALAAVASVAALVLIVGAGDQDAADPSGTGDTAGIAAAGTGEAAGTAAGTGEGATTAPGDRPVRPGLDEEAARALARHGASGDGTVIAPSGSGAAPGPPPPVPPARRSRVGPDPAAVYAVPVGDAPVRGPADALVTVVEFTEYACPFCERVRPTLDQLLDVYRTKVRLVHRSMIVHPALATVPAQAACAATRQGKFEQLDRLLWTKAFGQKNFEPEHIDALARQAGLDMRAYRRDRDGVCRDIVAGDQQLAARFGVRGTPAFFINGRFMQGSQPTAAFRRLIDEELARARERVEGGTPPARYYEEWVIGHGLDRVVPPAEAPAEAPPGRAAH